MTKNDNQCLAIVALASSSTNIIQELTHITAQHLCTVIDSYFIKLGDEYAAHLLVTGSWSAIAKTEASLQTFERKEDVTLFLKRTELDLSLEPTLPYLVYIIAQNEPHVIEDIAQFFTEQNIPIQELSSDSYQTRQSKTAMLSITLRVLLPGDTSISELRERFMVFCDDLNLDAIMEPEKS